MCHTNFADYNITNAVKHDTLRHERPKEIKKKTVALCSASQPSGFHLYLVSNDFYENIFLVK